MGRLERSLALGVAFVLALAACGGGDDADRESLIEDRLRIGNTQEEAECYADAVIDEFGGDPAADGQLSDDDLDTLLDLAYRCVGGTDG